jgi:cobalt-zinc-cadmium resistance protein CzcA
MAQPIEMRFNELMEGVRADVAVKIFGNDYELLEKTAEQVKEIVEKIPGAGEVEFKASGRVPMQEARVNRETLVKYNLPASEVNRAIATALGGQTGTRALPSASPFSIFFHSRRVQSKSGSIRRA